MYAPPSSHRWSGSEYLKVLLRAVMVIVPIHAGVSLGDDPGAGEVEKLNVRVFGGGDRGGGVQGCGT